MQNYFTLTYFSLVITLLLTTSACRKVNNVNEPANCRLTKVLTVGVDTAVITYDTNNRLATYGSLKGALYSYDYSVLSANCTTQNYDTTYNSETIYLSFDALGRVIYINRYFIPHYVINHVFEYDSAGHIVLSEEMYEPTGGNYNYTKDSMIYEQGNLVAKYTFTKHNTDPYVLNHYIEISYLSNLNKIGSYIWSPLEQPVSISTDLNVFDQFYGASSKNLPLLTKYYDQNGVLYRQSAFEFILDENGYPTEESIVQSMNASPSNIQRKFEYSCQ